MNSTMDSNPRVTILEHYLASPSPGSETRFSLPLTFYDLWMKFSSVQRVFFFKYQYPKTYFIERTIPNLKESFALALKHYLPLAGKLICPLDSGNPKFIYVPGDTVPLIFAESSDDFKYLSAYHARDAERFCPLLPPFPPATNESNSRVSKLLSIQVTLFPNAGISIACINSHVIGDASSIVGFIKTWASISKLGTDTHPLADRNSLPLFERNLIQDPYGLHEKIWSLAKGTVQSLLIPFQPSISNNVRATFVLGPPEIQRLKNFVLSKLPNAVHTSSYVVTCAYVWTCLMKSGAAIGEEVNEEEEVECLVCPIDCRPRFDPPVPANYFGNCIVSVVVTFKRSQLLADDGFLTAASFLGEAIDKRVRNMDGVLRGDFLLDPSRIQYMRNLLVAGSPKFDPYAVDFGWGKPEKYEHLGAEKIMSLSNCTTSEGSLEVTLCLPNIKMDAFATFFREGLNNIM